MTSRTMLIALVTLAAGSAVWAFREAANLVLGSICAAFAVIMPIYGVWFLRKTRKLIL